VGSANEKEGPRLSPTTSSPLPTANNGNPHAVPKEVSQKGCGEERREKQLVPTGMTLGTGRELKKKTLQYKGGKKKGTEFFNSDEEKVPEDFVLVGGRELACALGHEGEGGFVGGVGRINDIGK